MSARLVLVVVLVCALGIAGCSGGGGSANTSSGADQGTTSPSKSAAISLPSGWKIEDVITPSEVGAVTGKGMTYFPEASSAAQDGKPRAGYTNEGKPNTKLFISVDVGGGEAGFESAMGFADQASVKAVSGLGDKAVACSFTGGNVGVLVLKGDAVIRIDWPPAVYGDDAQGPGGKLADLLLGRMFK
jgi:hypothetical protein